MFPELIFENIRIGRLSLLSFDVDSDQKSLHSSSKTNPPNNLDTNQLDDSKMYTHLLPLSNPHRTILQIIYN